MRNTMSLFPEGGSASVAVRLETAREAVDAVDDALLDLVERRLALSLQIAALKNEDDQRLKLRPRREAAITSRLAARANLATPEMIAHLWRELMAHSLQAQVRTELVLCAAVSPDLLRDQVRERFGWAAPIVWAETPDEALDEACHREAIAVIEHSASSNWWSRLADEPSLSIFDAMRLGDKGAGALLVGRVSPDDVPDDQNFQILDAGILQQRLGSGERIETVAATGSLRLCRVLPDQEAAR